LGLNPSLKRGFDGMSPPGAQRLTSFKANLERTSFFLKNNTKNQIILDLISKEGYCNYE
jgi:hypothetical protein